MDLVDEIKQIIEKAITNYLDNKKTPEIKHVILDKIFPAEMRVTAIMHGLRTSFGIKVWETLAKVIAKRYGFTINEPSNLIKPTKLPENVSAFMSEALEERKSNPNHFKYDLFLEGLRRESRCIPNVENLEFEPLPPGDGIDLWLTKDGHNYIFDLKTVTINAGDGNNFAGKVMHWYAYRIIQDPDIQLQVAMAFPYSSYPPFTTDSWKKSSSDRAKPLIQGVDALVQEEFWNLISEPDDSWKMIMEAIDQLNTDLSDRYHDLFYPK